MAKSVLVVDDEPNIMLSLEYLMKRAGYDVRLARDGEEALASVIASPRVGPRSTTKHSPAAVSVGRSKRR